MEENIHRAKNHQGINSKIALSPAISLTKGIWSGPKVALNYERRLR